MRFKIKDGFSIVSSGSEGQIVDGVVTSISSTPSDSKLPSEKAVSDAIDGANYKYRVAIDANDVNPNYLSTKFNNSDTITTPTITYPGNIKMLTPMVSGGTSGQILQSTGSTEAQWVDRPLKYMWTIDMNQCSTSITNTVDRTYFYRFYGTPGITEPVSIRTSLYTNGAAGTEIRAYIFSSGDDSMTYYGAQTFTESRGGVSIPLTKLGDFSTDFTAQYLAICIHSGTAAKFRKGSFLSGCWYYDSVFNSGDAKPANSNMTQTTEFPCIALVGR